MSTLPDPRLETASFGARRWFVGDNAFSTEEDAKAAIRLAEFHAASEKQDFAEELRSKINGLFP